MDKENELILSELILPIIKEIVTPKIQQLLKKGVLKTTDEQVLESNFDDYLTQRYEKFLTIDTLVFPNKQTDFRILYEPLTVVSQTRATDPIEITIVDYPKSFLPEFIRIIIEDTAGMGKSTITRKLFLSAIEQQVGIPILIELRQINEENSFLTEIQKQLSGFGTKEKINLDIIINLLNEGQFIFLFDGFDEISKVDKEFVINDLHRFVEKANNNYFLITSREEESLVSLGDFQKFFIRPLTKQEAFNLIKRYDEYSFKKISSELIKNLENSKDETLLEFLSNPFLVSLLYKSFEYKKDVPNRKSQFYRQVFDALFESHDLSKEGYFKRDKFSNLHIDDFETVLRYISYLTSIENKVEYSKDYIINVIKKVKIHLPSLNFQASDYLRDLIETVPLFKKEGNRFKWAHKSLQDYFTAKFIWIDAKERQNAILRKIYEDPENSRFYNILDLFYELDIRTFENTFILWVLEDFESYVQNTFSRNVNVSKRSINLRLQVTFVSRNLALVVDSNDNIGVPNGVTNYHEFDKHHALNSYINTLFNFAEDDSYYHSAKLTEILGTYKAIILEKRDHRYTFLRFLVDKGDKVVSVPKFVRNKQLPIEMNLGEVYPINDDPNSPVNSKENFDKVTDLLSYELQINFNEAIKRLSKIRLNISQDLSDDLMNW